MSVRQFLFCVFFGPPFALIGLALPLLYLFAVPVIWLVGEKHPFREGWDMLAEPFCGMFMEGYRGF